jgi:hypothetical protein
LWGSLLFGRGHLLNRSCSTACVELLKRGEHGLSLLL